MTKRMIPTLRFTALGMTGCHPEEHRRGDVRIDSLETVAGKEQQQRTEKQKAMTPTLHCVSLGETTACHPEEDAPRIRREDQPHCRLYSSAGRRPAQSHGEKSEI